MPEKTKKTERMVKPRMFSIQCTKPGAPKDTAQLFQLNGMNYYVPYNKPVLVPEWVYVLWLDSEYNADRDIKAPLQENNHLVTDDDPYR